MNSKNHHVLFGSAVTKWMQFLITVLEIRISREFPKRFKLAGTYKKRKIKIELERKCVRKTQQLWNHTVWRDGPPVEPVAAAALVQVQPLPDIAVLSS